MKYIFFILSIISLYACGSSHQKNDQQAIDSNLHNNDTAKTTWIDDFRQYRDAIYRGDISKAKRYFKFPVYARNNEIWMLVLSDAALAAKHAFDDSSLPFTEKDFTVYFKKLFPPEYIKTILKIKSEELYQKGETETDYFEKDSTTTYKMYATVDRETNILSLNLFFNRNLKDKDGNVLDGGESSIAYTFIIQPNGRLLFKEIRIAG